jgi:penicillin-binding protein 1A
MVMQKPPKKIKCRRILEVLFLLLAAFVLLQGAFVLLVRAGTFGKLPGYQELKEIQNPMATEVYSADGVLMGTYYIENRQFLEPSEIPEGIKNALIATEDVRFYSHRGIDTRSLFRVLFKSLLLRREGSGGGSTLTQQLAKNLYPRESFGILTMPVSKVKEMITAVRMEKVYSKQEILEMYLGTVSFGENTFGIKAASRRYFNKDPQDLTLEESAALVGMLKATRIYNPVNHPERALERRNVVLRQMNKNGYLKDSHADSLQVLPLEVDYHPLPHNAGIAPYFREFLRRELDAWCRVHHKSEGEPYNLYTDGLKVYTTIDSRLQQYAEEAMQGHMKHLQEVFDEQWAGKDLWEGLTEKQLLINYDGEQRSGMASEPRRAMEVFTWRGMQERNYNTLDSIRHYLGLLQAGFLAMEVGTAEIKAWVGGINHEHFKFDHVLARRQAGSTFKPLVYLTALEQGISPCEYFANDSVVYEEHEGWTPRNADLQYGGYYSMQGALVHSVNTVSVDLLMRVGIDSVLMMSEKAGITSTLLAVPSLALGSGEISLFELVGAYQAMANLGVAREPLCILRIEDRNGQVLEEAGPPAKGRAICSPENAEIMIEMLRGVVNHGTASALRNTYGIPAAMAGKTGTTQNYADGWFIGFTPDLVAGAWVGGDLQNVRFQTLQYGQGAYTALPIWAGFMRRTLTVEAWRGMQKDTFLISETTRSQLMCEDYREKKPFRFKPFKKLKEKQSLRNLFRRRRNR